MHEDAPRVATVLLNCRAEEEAMTVDCIRSLQAGAYPNLEIVLVDNGSPPEVGRRLSSMFQDIHVIHTGANLGFTGGNNRGIEWALDRDCDYVLVLNNDTIVEPDCISRLVQTARADQHIGCVGGKILFSDAPDRLWFGGGVMVPSRGIARHVGLGERDPDPQGGSPGDVTFLTGCCMLLSAKALREVGTFEEDFFIYVEDVELSHRLTEHGYRLVYEPRARLYHRVPVDEPPIPPHKIVLRDRNRRRFVRRRFSTPRRLRFAAFFYPSRIVHALRYLVRRDIPRARAIWQGMVER